jgi:hypothetical protein
MDCDRYLTLALYNSHRKLTPKVAEVIDPRQVRNHQKRIELLKRIKKPHHGSEEFS